MHDFPLTAWRYQLRLEIDGTDRSNLPDCLEEEELALFHYVSRQAVYDQIRDGTLVFSQTLDAPLAAFPDDLAVLSLYLFQIVKGIEVAERYVAPDRTDDVRAWKIVARRGAWVKVPLMVRPHPTLEGAFLVDEDAEDLDVMRAHWATYPRWFQDGMRRKYPVLRAL